MREPAALVVSSGALLGGAIFFGGGSGDGSVWWVGGGVLLVATVALARALVGRRELPRLGVPEVGLLAAGGGLVVWTGLSVLWSVAPDRSWAAFDKGLVVAGFVVLGLLVGGGGGPRMRAAALLLAGLLGAALVWSLAGKAIPGLFPDGGRAARLRSPVGYWNGLALLADFALPLGLWLGTRVAHSRTLRVAGALLVYAAVAALGLAASRTGVATAVAAVGLWLLLSDRRVEGALLGLAGALPAAALVGFAFTRPALVEDGQTNADRVRDGAVFGVLALAGAALVAGIVVWGLERGLRRRREMARSLALVSGAAIVAGLAALVLAVGNPVTWVGDRLAEDTAAANDPTRLASLSSNNRAQWWDEAWQVFRADRLTGAGAGTFQVARKRFRENAVEVTQPHSVPLQVLAGGGVVGFAWFCALVALGVVVTRRAIGRLGGEERPAAVALAVLPAAWLLHGLADYDLDFLAVTAPPFFVLGLLSAAGQRLVLVRRVGWAIAVVAMAVVAFAVLAGPPLAERGVDASLRALERGDFERAEDAARLAAQVDPFSLRPLIARARVAQLRGDEAAAREAYADAVRLQPRNPDSWYLLGLYELSLGDECSAYGHLNEAYTLDPSGRRWTPGGPLDIARDAVDAGACEAP